MKEVDGDPFTYTVQNGEEITLKVTPIGVGKFVTVVIDAVAQPKPPNLTYGFSVTMPTGQSHTVLMEFNFPGVSDPNARYDVEISATKAGVPNGGPFSFSVFQADPNKEPEVQFTVV